MEAETQSRTPVGAAISLPSALFVFLLLGAAAFLPFAAPDSYVTSGLTRLVVKNR